MTLTSIAENPWLPAACAEVVAAIESDLKLEDRQAVEARLFGLVEDHERLMDRESLGLNAGTNVMNPRATALLGRSLGNRPSQGYPGDKYEMGMEYAERITAGSPARSGGGFAGRLRAEPSDECGASCRLPRGLRQDEAQVLPRRYSQGKGHDQVTPRDGRGDQRLVTHEDPGAFEGRFESQAVEGEARPGRAVDRLDPRRPQP